MKILKIDKYAQFLLFFCFQVGIAIAAVFVIGLIIAIVFFLKNKNNEKESNFSTNPSSPPTRQNEYASMANVLDKQQLTYGESSFSNLE